MIDTGVKQGDFEYVKMMGIFMIVITLIGITLNILLTYFGARLNTSIIIDIRDDMYKNMQTFSHQEYEQLGVSSLITRTTNDAYQVMQCS